FDAGTLQVHDAGVYFSSARTLLWEVGELGPGVGGKVHFTVQVPPDVVSGTVILAGATVYFPSVPETTPTNDVLSIVSDVVAYSQYVETMEGEPANITLAGLTPTGNPLTFEIVDEPFWGTMAGTLPSLVFTPTAGFEGGDSFSFRVNDGLNTSLPAQVSIQVNTGAESIPPEVLFVRPSGGSIGVRVYSTPMVDNEYLPDIWAQFSEPISSTTVTTQTLFIKNKDGELLECQPIYDPAIRRAELQLLEPLETNQTYTVTLTTGVLDTSGNPLEADFMWSFNTTNRIYLPLVVKQ
ncbi:MAG: Ig-like domain-containing protein, partial [Anaerolineales bacterium]|nr:Ig-like domain-containing protein [Anaerolineales bacterium]